MSDGEDDDAMPGQDSFIDVVCNMVGILIVLVMIVGVRASSSNSPAAQEGAAAPATLSVDPQALAEIEARRKRFAETAREVEQSVSRLKDLETQSLLIEARREQLAIVQASVEKEIQDRRAKLDADAQKQFDVQNAIATAEMKLHELTQQQISLVATTADVEEVECVPTPLARTVTGEEIHVRLRHGRLAVVPADELMQEVERRGADHLRSGLSSRNEAQDVFGPIDGFRMRLSVERHVSAMPGAPNTPQRAEVVIQGVFLPVADEVGEQVDQALLPGSAFMRALRAKRSAAPAVTVWVYPDSYGELRLLKRAMWEAGSPLAVRPLPEGHPIIFSTAGSKSAAQ